MAKPVTGGPLKTGGRGSELTATSGSFSPSEPVNVKKCNYYYCRIKGQEEFQNINFMLIINKVRF